jgi:hypothetical protein
MGPRHRIGALSMGHRTGAGRPLLGSMAVAVALTAWPAPAAAAAPIVDVRIEENRELPRRIPQYVPVVVTIVDRATKAPPEDDYNVYALAENRAGERTASVSCGQRSDNNPGVPRGIYDCTVIVDHGGQWTMVGVVNTVPAGDDRPVRLARVATEVTVAGGALAGMAPKDVEIKGQFTAVAALWLHSAFAAAWFAVLGGLALLAFPGLRRRLSPLGLHRIEDRLGTMARLLFGTTLVVIGTGTYLLVQQTAYTTPLSATAVRGVLRLPYGKPYFLALVVKLVVYGMMVAASVVVARAAFRRSTLRLDEAVSERAAAVSGGTGRHRSPWDDPPRICRPAGTLVRERAPAVEAPIGAASVERPMALRSAGVTVVAGGLAIWICVTVLKYCHELIEAARAVLRQ